jgi:hypothetical protein
MEIYRILFADLHPCLCVRSELDVGSVPYSPLLLIIIASHIKRAKSMFYRLAHLLLIASVAFTFIISLIMLAISRTNYPGGTALSRLHDLVNQEGNGNSNDFTLTYDF